MIPSNRKLRKLKHALIKESLYFRIIKVWLGKLPVLFEVKNINTHISPPY